MRDNALLQLYRKKRSVDGLNGRHWHAEKHLQYEQAIEAEEQRRNCTCVDGLTQCIYCQEIHHNI